MKPHITLKEIAGYATEKAVWQLLLDLSALCGKEQLCGLTADEVMLQGTDFLLHRRPSVETTAFTSFDAPETFSRKEADAASQASDVWTLGALAFYAITGMDVFEGKGGATQTAETAVPQIGSAHAGKQLSTLIHQCLAYAPSARPTAEAITRLAREQLAQPAMPRKRLSIRAGQSYAESLVKFWPEEMVPLLVAFLLLLSSASLRAQTASFDPSVVPNEMVSLVMRCIDLRSPANQGKVKRAMDRDMNWTMMDELPVDKEGECTTKHPVDMFGLNDIGFSILKLHGGVTNSGGRFRDGRDPRYKYSLIEVTVRQGASVNYQITGREGTQLFAVVPFDKEARFSASIPDAMCFTDNGVCYLQLKRALKQADQFQLTIKNESGKHAAFVIINYNSHSNE